VTESSRTPGDGAHSHASEGWSAEITDEALSLLEERVIALEEVAAARWPRSWLLRRRLGRSLRASALAHAHAGRSWRARRLEAASEDIALRTPRRPPRDAL
jgi:hypothetical protein